MIARTASLLALIYALGFVFFALTLGKPAGADVAPTEAAVVLTGGSNRIEHAIDMHCHFGPDTIGGREPIRLDETTVAEDPEHAVTGYDAAREAHESGHKAIVLKSHSFCSAQLAAFCTLWRPRRAGVARSRAEPRCAARRRW